MLSIRLGFPVEGGQLTPLKVSECGMSDDRIPMTQEGYEKKKAELDHMRHVKLTEIATRVASARDLGDLSENAEYHAAREDHAQLQAMVNDLQGQLAMAYIVDKSTLPKDEVAFGSRVTVHDEDRDEVEVFDLVGPGQDDPMNGRIMISSPVGQGLLGKKKGEIAEIQAPKRLIRYKILKIGIADE